MRAVVGIVLVVPLFGCERETWDYRIYGDNGSAVMETDGFTLIAEGERVDHRHSGNLQVVGRWRGQGELTEGADTILRDRFEPGLLELEFFGHRMEVVDRGGTLRIGGEMYDLADRPVIRIAADGSTRVAEP